MKKDRPTILQFPGDGKKFQDFFSGLKPGATFVYPTETLYALGCDSFDEEGIANVYRVKARGPSLPLPLLADGWEMLEKVVSLPSETRRKWLACYWPGPLTVVLRGIHPLRKRLNANDGSLAVRMTSSPAALKIMEILKRPIVGTSANRSGKATGDRPAALVRTFGGQVDGYVDGGEAAGKIPSTIIDLRNEKPVVLRQGAIRIEV